MMDFIKQIKTGPLASVYVVHGPQDHIKDQVLNALKERATAGAFGAWNYVSWRVDERTEADAIINDLATPPWGDEPKIVVVKAAENLSTAELNELVSYMSHIQETHCLAMFFSKLDKRLKSVKSLLAGGTEIAAEDLRGESLIRWVQDYCRLQGCSLKAKAASECVARVGSDLALLQKELDKLVMYVGVGNSIELPDVEALTTIMPEKLEERAIFRMTDALAAKNAKEALSILHTLIDNGESPLRVLPLIDRQLRLLLAAKTRGDEGIAACAKTMGESTDYALRKASRFVARFQLEELFAGFEYVVMADRELKLVTDGEQVLERLIMRICYEPHA